MVIFSAAKRVRPVWRTFFIAAGALALGTTAHACEAGTARTVTATLYQIVQRSSGIPTAHEMVRLKPLVSARLMNALLTARKSEDRWLARERAAGRDAWAEEGALFSSENEGFSSWVVRHFDERTLRQQVHFRLQLSAEDKGFEWDDQVVFASEAGRCVITDIVFRSGGSLQTKLLEFIADMR